MDVKTGTEAAQFPEKEYINGNFVAVSCKIEHSQFFLSIYLYFILPAPLLVFLYFFFVFNTSHRADADPRIEAKRKEL
jgi:hypothetical protein